jgi:hypothetical protein
VFAAVCVVLTGVGHSLADGRPVGATAVAVGFVIVFAAALAGGRRERSLGVIIVGLLAGQAGLHELFVFLDATTPAGPVGHPHHGGHLAMADRLDMAGMPPLDGATGPAMHAGQAMHGGWAMPLAHLAAGLVAGWWLRRGEAASWRLLARTGTAAAALRRTLRQLVQVATSPAESHLPVTVCTHAHRELGTATCALVVASAPRRGPPCRR